MNRDQYLAHFGVKGMRWGVRKKKPVLLNTKADERDIKLYGRRGAKRIKNRIVNKGMSRSKAQNREIGRSIALAPIKGLAAATAGLGVLYVTNPNFRATVNVVATSAIRQSRETSRGQAAVSNYLGLNDYVADPSEYVVHYALHGGDML